jgi:glycosyltransferase involved in cell wall biosynthesis
MRIAQVAPLTESVPPSLYGGTERVVSWLTEELVEKGHEVTLFASGDSRTSAKLVPCAPLGLRLVGIRDETATLLVMLNRVLRMEAEFDVIHLHTDLLQFPVFRNLAHKSLTTLHGRLDMPDRVALHQAFPDMPLISISDDQRAPMPPHVDWLATIHHGMRGGIPFGHGGRDLVFLGRISPEKRPDRAIEIAIQAGVGITIAAKVDDVDRAYFQREIEPLLSHPLVRFIGEVDEAEKASLLGEALALIFPIDWPEPFGLVMIEAMAAGTPVIAWRNGSVPEVIRDGRSGVIVGSMEEAVAAVGRVQNMDRRAVRQEYDERFTSSRMADDYISAYQRLLARPSRLAPHGPDFSQAALFASRASSQAQLPAIRGEVRP